MYAKGDAFEIAAGDKLLLTANRREPGFRATNGEIVTVDRIDPKKRVHLADGRVLPANFRQFTHGYAVTAHRSQGKSVDSVIISGDGMQKELFYVAASRGRESVQVITSDKETLRESVGTIERPAVRFGTCARGYGPDYIRGCIVVLRPPAISRAGQVNMYGDWGGCEPRQGI